MSRISHGGTPGWAPFLPSIGCPPSLLSSYWSSPNIPCVWLAKHFSTLNFYWLCTIWMKRCCGKQELNVLKYFRASTNSQKSEQFFHSVTKSAMCIRYWVLNPTILPVYKLPTALLPERKTKTRMLPQKISKGKNDIIFKFQHHKNLILGDSVEETALLRILCILLRCRLSIAFSVKMRVMKPGDLRKIGGIDFGIAGLHAFNLAPQIYCETTNKCQHQDIIKVR